VKTGRPECSSSEESESLHNWDIWALLSSRAMFHIALASEPQDTDSVIFGVERAAQNIAAVCCDEELPLGTGFID